jgi:catechol 2,3-dioxygenase-like lactoylglutathione lyase family enzyme
MTTPHSPFNRFHHVVVAVADPEAVVADWSRLFGTPALPGRRVAVGDAWIEFTPPEGDRTGVVRVAVEVDDVAIVAERARAAGAAVTDNAGRTVIELSGVRIELRDEDGALEPPGIPSFNRFHHVVVAVNNDDQATGVWNHVFGFTPAPEGPDGQLASHHVPVGDAWFGLTATGTDAGAIGKFIERRGEGVYALALVVRDRADFAASVAAAGGRILGEPDDFQVFVHPATTHGVLLELASEWPGGIRRPTP